MKRISVTEYDDPYKFVKDTIESYRTTPHAFSIRKLSSKLKLKSSGQLSDILNQKRPFRIKLAQQIASEFKLTSSETDHFIQLVLLWSSKEPFEKQFLKKHLTKSKKQIRLSHVKEMDSKSFSSISNIFTIGVLESIPTDRQKLTAQEIHSHLKFKCTFEQLKQILKTLVAENLIVEKEGQFFRLNNDGYSVPDSPKAFVIRDFHKSSLDLAKESIEALDTANRNLQCSVVGIEKKQLPLLQEIIRNFHEDIMSLSNIHNADFTFIINSQSIKFSERKGL